MRMSRALAFLAAVTCLGTLACETIPIGSDRSDAGHDGAAARALTCTADPDCVTFVDYCPKTCGQCVASAAPAPVSQCQPPPGVFCMNVCEMMRAVCRTGKCVLQ